MVEVLKERVVDVEMGKSISQDIQKDPIIENINWKQKKMKSKKLLVSIYRQKQKWQ